MDKTLNDLFSTLGLPEELTNSISEAFEKKVAEAREEAELSIREEFATRYDHDKGQLVEAMDRMLTDVAQTTEDEKVKELEKLKEASARFDTAIVEAKAEYKSKLSEHAKVVKKLVTETLAKEVKSLNEQTIALAKKEKALEEAFEAVKAEVAEKNAENVNKINKFVTKHIAEELREFETDKRALAEARVKLVTEGKQKLAEVRARFIAEAAKKVQATVNSVVGSQMAEIHEDLERNRQNQFGRRIFEAVAAEYLTSYMAEGTEIRNLQNILESKEAELSQTKNKLEEAAKTTEVVIRKARMVEAAAARSKVMTELLSSLSGAKKKVMESMLETTKTESLRNKFEQLLPVVLETNVPSTKKNLIENKGRIVTGDKQVIVETVDTTEEAEIDENIDNVLRLAGIK